jgi:phosphate transport system permease protein
LKRIFEKLIEYLLMMSSAVSSLTVLLIVVFLFSEGVSVFNESPLEDDMIVLINSSNPINDISAAQMKLIFDQDVVSWNELGGKKDSIIRFTLDDVHLYFSESEIGANFELLGNKVDSLVAKNSGMIAVVSTIAVPQNPKSKVIVLKNISPTTFFTGKEWFPTTRPAVQMGALPLILGTLWVSLFAIIIALPIGLATAIYLAEVADKRMRDIIKPAVELLAGIPSVVYGFFGLIVIVPMIQQWFNLPVGETGLAGSIVLAIMALPTIITLSEDAMRNTPRAMKEASLALGATHWQTISRVVLPNSISGISAAAILGMGRAIGETMAVLMVTGNAAVIPTTLLQPVRTIPATIAAELGEVPQNGIHFKALFALGCILFIITLLINIWVDYKSRTTKS